MINSKLKRIFYTFVLFIFVFQNFVFAAFSNNRTLNTRARGMGNSFVALSDDSGALIHNPAGLGKIKFYDVYFMYSDLYSDLRGVDITSSYASVIIPTHDMGSFGLNYYKFNGDDLYDEDSIGVHYGKEVLYKLNLGLGVSFLKHSYNINGKIEDKLDPVFQDGTSKSAVGVNLGLLYDLNDYFSLGFSAMNVNKPDIGLKNKDEIPADYKVGAAFKYNNLIIPVDFSYRDQIWGDENNKFTSSLGLEWWFSDMIGVRTGLTNYEASFGFSLFKKDIFDNLNIGLDYSLSLPLELQDTLGTHQLSLYLRFGEIKSYLEPKLEFYEYDKVHPKFSIVQGLSSYRAGENVVDLLFDGKLVYRFYATLGNEEPYARALNLARDLSKIMKFQVLREEDIRKSVRDGITYVEIGRDLMIPIDFDILLTAKDPDMFAFETIDRLKKILLINSWKKTEKQKVGERIVVAQGFTAIGEIGNIFIDNELKFTIFANGKDGKTPYFAALDFATIIGKYLGEGLSSLVIDSETTYGDFYLIIRGQKALYINNEAEFLNLSKDQVLADYMMRAFEVLVK